MRRCQLRRVTWRDPSRRLSVSATASAKFVDVWNVRWRWVLGAALATGAALAAAPSAMAAAWLSPVSVSAASPTTFTPQVAADAAGDSVVVWRQSVGAGPSVIQAATRAAGGGNSFGSPVTLSDGLTTLTNGVNPRVAMNAAGDAVVVWQTSDGRLQAAWKPAGQGFGTAQTIETDAAHFPVTPAVAMDAAGDAVAVWVHQPVGMNVNLIEAAYAPATTRSFGTPAIIVGSTSFAALQPQVAMDARGDATAVWLQSDGTNNRVWAANSASGSLGAFAGQAQISAAGGAANLPQVAMDQAGNATATWERLNATSHEVVQFADRQGPSGTFPANPSDLTGASVNSVEPQVFDNANGDTALTWTDNDTSEAVAAMRPHGAALFTSPQTLGTTGTTVADAIDAGGIAVAAWESNNPIVAATAQLSATAIFTTPQPVSAGLDTSNAPALAVDGQGDTVATWVDTTANTVQVAVRDSSVPVLTNVSVPATATAGVPVTLTAAAREVWSPTVSTSWSVDGSPAASGAATSYAFPSAGQHSVTVTVIDGAGNATTSAPLQVNVQPAPPPPAASGNATPVSGVVLVHVPGSSGFAPITGTAQIPNGSLVDATHGKVRITVPEPNGKTESGVFYGGEFVFTQARNGAVTAVLAGGSFSGCPSPARRHAARIARRGRHSTARSLWADAHGNFQTRGRYASGAVSGTQWLTQDRCDGTYIRVTRDVVLVTDFPHRHRHVRVRQGHSYLALAPGF